MTGLLDGAMLWYVNRGAGLVLLVLLSLSTALGVLSLGGRPAGDGGGRLPRFVRQSLHRNVALVSVAALVVHVAAAVLHDYVDIRWWQAFVPWGAEWQPLWTGLGALSLDLVAVVTLTSLLRHRIGPRAWRRVHYLSWLGWSVGLAHALGAGTDLRSPSAWTTWAVVPAAVSVLLVGGAVVVRLAARPTGAEAPGPALTGSA